MISPKYLKEKNKSVKMSEAGRKNAENKFFMT
jgi:hypothetical protein